MAVTLQSHRFRVERLGFAGFRKIPQGDRIVLVGRSHVPCGWRIVSIKGEDSVSYCEPHSKRAIISGITANPDSAWVTQQARNVTIDIENLGFPTPEVLIIDHDSKYTKEFDAVWSADGTKVKRVGPFAPNLNAFAERFAQTLRHECLDHFLILGEKYLRHLLKEFLEHYHEERPHQSLGNRPPNRPAESEEEAVIPFVKDPKPVKVVCRERLGGLLKSYSRIAA